MKVLNYSVASKVICRVGLLVDLVASELNFKKVKLNLYSAQYHEPQRLATNSIYVPCTTEQMLNADTMNQGFNARPITFHRLTYINIQNFIISIKGFNANISESLV